MAYSELIKNFVRIRDYMRDFYVYGFHTRSGQQLKSARSYDNERRRIESWLGEYMSFRQDREGRHVFLSADSRAVPRNPLYQAYKSKSFTVNDIMLHFLILDLLADGTALTATEMLSQITDRFRMMPETEWFPDESTLRKKLKEYTSLGILCRTKQGRDVFYQRTSDLKDLDVWKDALHFASETDPVGVIGSFLLDRFDDTHPDYGETGSGPAPILRFKHHYLLNALDQDILLQLMEARRRKCDVLISMAQPPDKKAAPLFTAQPPGNTEKANPDEPSEHRVCPLRFYCSTQNGRRHLLAWEYGGGGLRMFRLDRIRRVRLQKEVKLQDNPDSRECLADELRNHMWGVSVGKIPAKRMDHVEMEIHIEDHETYIRDRLFREKRCGTVRQTGDHTLCFTADVYDAMEMLPWIRTFTGRITSFSCSSPEISRRLGDDLRALREMYLTAPE